MPRKLLKKKPDLHKAFRRLQETPASFAFFVSIHDFVESIEANANFAADLSRDVKYEHLKRIHQGIKDIAGHSAEDLGHERYMTINDLISIRQEDVSDNNTFWRKREIFRKLAVEIYERLLPPAEGSKK